MDALLKRGVFEELDEAGRRRLSEIAEHRSLQAGEYVFQLGDSADDFYVLSQGKVDLCLPMPLRGIVKDVSVESVGVGDVLGWSALVKPYQFTLSARATEPSEIMGFARRDLLDLFEDEPGIGYALFTKIAETVGTRLHTFQALWVRELQRTLENEAQRHAEGSPTQPG